MIEIKICRTCQQEKPLDQFYAHQTNKDRLSGSCRRCFSQAVTDRKGKAAQAARVSAA